MIPITDATINALAGIACSYAVELHKSMCQADLDDLERIARHKTDALKARIRAELEARGNAPGQVPGFIKPDNNTHVYFYEQDLYVLSNFSAFTLDWRNLRFDTSEAAYHYEKFIGGAACCDEIAHRILMASSAHEAFKIAEANREHRRPDWDSVKVGVMRTILRAKAGQHEYVRRKLLATGDRILVEDSWRDSYWGWGPNRDGQNVLGKLWMEVRAELREALAAKGDHP